MANKSNKIVNKIGTVNIEIDYEKIAEAIVKAEKKVNENKSYTANTFAALSGMLFRIFSLIGFFLSVASIIGIVGIFGNYDWKSVNLWVAISELIIIGISVLVIITLSILLMKAAKEIEDERDKQFVVAVFSAIVSFTALMVALVSLIK